MIGMFEIIGRFSSVFSSKFMPDDTVFVSRIGATPVTSMRSLIWPTSSFKLRLNAWPTDNTMLPWLNVLKPGMATVTS